MLLWLVMEEVCNLPPATQVVLFSDNHATVHRLYKLTAQTPVAAMSSPGDSNWPSFATNTHSCSQIANVMTHIPSCLFGPEKQCDGKTHSNLLLLFNKISHSHPRPPGETWHELYRCHFCAEDAGLFHWHVEATNKNRMIHWHNYLSNTRPSLIYRASHSCSKSDASQDLRDMSCLTSIIEENKSRPEQSLWLYQSLSRQFPWSAI